MKASWLSAWLVAACGVVQAAPATSPPTIAIVLHDQAALRAAPRESAPQQAMLWQGDALELRGERLDHLLVYDHRRERAGFVRASQVRQVTLSASEAPELLSVLRFLRGMPGQEALGIAYAAAYLRAAPAEAITAEPFDALGAMAERLARRASSRQAKGLDAVLAAHLELAASYGVAMASVEHDGVLQLCYDGDAFRRVLAMPSASPEQQVRAVLALTRHDCIASTLRVVERQALDEARAAMLERVDHRMLPQPLRNRVLMRRAGVWSAVAFARTRQGADGGEAAQRALDALAGVDPNALHEADQAVYAEAAVRTGASRWAAEPAVAPPSSTRLAVLAQPGEPGQTCVQLVDTSAQPAKPLARRCTYGIAWTGSVRVNPSQQAVALAVQPLAGWRELWVFRRVKGQWVADVMPPPLGDPQLGVVEFAGWVPGGTQLLAAREARVDGRIVRSFEVLRIDTLAVVKRSASPSGVEAFRKWQDAGWRRQTVSVR